LAKNGSGKTEMFLSTARSTRLPPTCIGVPGPWYPYHDHELVVVPTHSQGAAGLASCQIASSQVTTCLQQPYSLFRYWFSHCPSMPGLFVTKYNTPKFNPNPRSVSAPWGGYCMSETWDLRYLCWCLATWASTVPIVWPCPFMSNIKKEHGVHPRVLQGYNSSSPTPEYLPRIASYAGCSSLWNY
jgi:hypothetical protein